MAWLPHRQRHLDKDVETRHRGRNKYRRPTLEELQPWTLFKAMLGIKNEALRDGVVAVHWGGREQKFLARMAVPMGVFTDALKFVRYCLGAKGNGSFPKHVKYGDQISLALAFFIMVLAGVYQNHRGFDDANFTVKFLMGFVKALENRRRRGALYQAMLQIYKAPSLKWSPRSKAKKAKRGAPAKAKKRKAKKAKK